MCAVRAMICGDCRSYVPLRPVSVPIRTPPTVSSPSRTPLPSDNMPPAHHATLPELHNECLHAKMGSGAEQSRHLHADLALRGQLLLNGDNCKAATCSVAGLRPKSVAWALNN
jgi:hypothetical protein